MASSLTWRKERFVPEVLPTAATVSIGCSSNCSYKGPPPLDWAAKLFTQQSPSFSAGHSMEATLWLLCDGIGREKVPFPQFLSSYQEQSRAHVVAVHVS